MHNEVGLSLIRKFPLQLRSVLSINMSVYIAIYFIIEHQIIADCLFQLKLEK